MSIAERVRLFDRPPPKTVTAAATAVRGKRRHHAPSSPRFQTQPVTVDEVQEASRIMRASLVVQPKSILKFHGSGGRSASPEGISRG